MSRRIVYTTTGGKKPQPMLTLFDGQEKVDCFSAKSREPLVKVAQDWMGNLNAEYIARKWAQGSYHK